MKIDRIIALGLFAVLSLISAVHLYWALGGLWPGETLEELILTVIGDPRFSALPPAWMTIGVASAIALAGFIALERVGICRILPKWMSDLGCWILFLIFGMRGLSSFLVAFDIKQMNPPLTEPFAALDVKFYGPLCVLIALGFLFISLKKGRHEITS